MTAPAVRLIGVDALYRRDLSRARAESSSGRSHSSLSITSHPTTSAIEATVATTSRQVDSDPARSHTVELMVAMAPVASAATRADLRPGTRSHDRGDHVTDVAWALAPPGPGPPSGRLRAATGATMSRSLYSTCVARCGSGPRACGIATPPPNGSAVRLGPDGGSLWQPLRRLQAAGVALRTDVGPTGRATILGPAADPAPPCLLVTAAGYRFIPQQRA